MKIDNVDIVCGLCWGDEAKGKIVSNLLIKDKYDWVCRWSGGSNAGHTIYINDIKYVTHIIPCGIFDRGVTSMEELLGSTQKMEKIRTLVIDKFNQIFMRN